MKIYTRTGDDGSTGRLGGARISKSDPLVHALGDLDELSAALGLAAARLGGTQLARCQGELLSLGAELAAQPGDERFVWREIAESTRIFEQEIDEMDVGLPKLSTFILPGGIEVAAQLHLARAICRRAERSVVALDPEPRSEVIQWLNRLSDWLFTLARYANAIHGSPDVKWEQR